MNGFKEYLKGYVGGVKSLLVGMRTSMKGVLPEENYRTVS